MDVLVLLLIFIGLTIFLAIAHVVQLQKMNIESIKELKSGKHVIKLEDIYNAHLDISRNEFSKYVGQVLKERLRSYGELILPFPLFTYESNKLRHRGYNKTLAKFTENYINNDKVDVFIYPSFYLNKKNMEVIKNGPIILCYTPFISKDDPIFNKIREDTKVRFSAGDFKVVLGKDFSLNNGEWRSYENNDFPRYNTCGHLVRISKETTETEHEKETESEDKFTGLISKLNIETTSDKGLTEFKMIEFLSNKVLKDKKEEIEALRSSYLSNHIEDIDKGIITSDCYIQILKLKEEIETRYKEDIQNYYRKENDAETE